MIRSNFILLLFICLSFSSFSQKVGVFDQEIKSLNSIGKEIIGSETDEEKYRANKKFKSEIKTLIENNASFDYDFKSLTTISILKSADLKVYNWALPLIDGTFEYFAFIQIQKSKDAYSIVELIDKSESIKTPENKVLTSKSWYGALYYKVIQTKKLGKNYYTLLGWDGNNNLTNKKIIDVINVSENGMVKLGAPIFKTKKKTKKRIIFEYSENAVMSLKYQENMGKIVFDFLVPESSKLEGIYEYYGPSLNRFDAFGIDNKKWLYENDINIELDKNMKDFFWKDPKEK